MMVIQWGFSNMNDNLMLDDEEIKSYLIGSIILWRERVKGKDKKFKKMAPYYIDAFQSVLVTLFGETFPEKGGNVEH